MSSKSVGDGATCALWTAASAQGGPSSTKRAQVHRKERKYTVKSDEKASIGVCKVFLQKVTCTLIDAYCVTHTLTHAENLTVALPKIIPTATPT